MRAIDLEIDGGFQERIDRYQDRLSAPLSPVQPSPTSVFQDPDAKVTQPYDPRFSDDKTGLAGMLTGTCALGEGVIGSCGYSGTGVPDSQAGNVVKFTDGPGETVTTAAADESASELNNVPTGVGKTNSVASTTAGEIASAVSGTNWVGGLILLIVAAWVMFSVARDV